MTPEDEEFEAIAKRQDRIQRAKEAFESAKKREWVGLTDEEKRQILLDDPIDWIKAIEAKLKEKNNR
jgi:hypothetical protein